MTTGKEANVTDTNFHSRVKARKGRKGIFCSAGVFLARLAATNPDLYQGVVQALDDRELFVPDIIATLVDEEGFAPDDIPAADRFTRHRRGECKNCPERAA